MEAESDYAVPFELRTEDSAGVDLGPLDLSSYDPGGNPNGGGFACELRDRPGGTLKATGAVTMRGTRATGTLTSTSNPADSDTVTIGTTTYTFNTTASGIGSILIGADAEASLANLAAAINGTTDATSPEVGLNTPAHLDVVASLPTTATLKAECKDGGTQGNAIASTEASTVLSWGAVALTGGTGRRGVLLAFDGQDIPSTLLDDGVSSASFVYDIFGLLGNGSPKKLVAGRVQFFGSATDPNP